MENNFLTKLEEIENYVISLDSNPDVIWKHAELLCKIVRIQRQKLHSIIEYEPGNFAPMGEIVFNYKERANSAIEESERLLLGETEGVK